MADSIGAEDSTRRDLLTHQFTNKRLHERLQTIERDHETLSETHRTMSKEMKETVSLQDKMIKSYQDDLKAMTIAESKARATIKQMTI